MGPPRFGGLPAEFGGLGTVAGEGGWAAGGCAGDGGGVPTSAAVGLGDAGVSFRAATCCAKIFRRAFSRMISSATWGERGCDGDDRGLAHLGVGKTTDSQPLSALVNTMACDGSPAS